MIRQLHTAAKKGDKDGINLLIEKGVDVNTASTQGKKTALMYAAECGHSHLFSLLLDAGAKVNALDKYGQPALLCGIKKGFGNAACALLRYGADPNITDCYGKTALTCAVVDNQNDVVGRLLASGGNIHSTYRDGKSLYEQARQCGNARIIELLWVHGAELDLAGAAMLGNVEDMEAMIAIGCNVNQQNGYGGRSILMGACFFGQTAATAFLLDAGADIDVSSFSGTALCYAARGGRTDTLTYLLKRGANPDIEGMPGSALLIAAVKGHWKTAQVLWEWGAKVGLHEASALGDNTVVEALLDAGLNIDQYNTVDNWTPLMLAVDRGHYSTAHLLLLRGASVNGERGRRTLKIAQQKSSRFVDLLKEFGAEETIVGSKCAVRGS